MNNDFIFLENFYLLIRQGYGIEETLKVCQKICNHQAINNMLDAIYQGQSINDVLLNQDFPKDFLEFFEFFNERLTLSDAIEHALDICKKIEYTKKQIYSKMTYPLILLTFLILFSLFAIFILFPRIETLFQSFAMSPPLLFMIIFNLMKILPILILGVIGVIFISFIKFISALRNKKYLVIENFLKIPLLKWYIQKYFTLKFALYFNELLHDKIDSHTIIAMLNKKLTHSDLKIVVYEIYIQMQEGESLEDIIEDFDYFDPLFVTMYKMFLQSPETIQDLSSYIHISLQQIESTISKILKYFIPTVYSFVAIFVISVYLAIILPMMNIIGDI